MFSRSLIARRTITAIIVAAQSTVERPLVALKYCIAKRPIITAAKTAGHDQLAPAVAARRRLISAASAGCQAAAPRQTAAIR